MPAAAATAAAATAAGPAAAAAAAAAGHAAAAGPAGADPAAAVAIGRAAAATVPPQQQPPQPQATPQPQAPQQQPVKPPRQPQQLQLSHFHTVWHKTGTCPALQLSTSCADGALLRPRHGGCGLMPWLLGVGWPRMQGKWPVLMRRPCIRRNAAAAVAAKPQGQKTFRPKISPTLYS